MRRVVVEAGHRRLPWNVGRRSQASPGRGVGDRPGAQGRRHQCLAAHELQRRLHVGVHVAVVVEPRHLGAQQRPHRLQRRARDQRRVEVAALGGREQLDGHHGEGVVGHRRQAPRAVRGHRHVVLLVGGGGDRIDACRKRPLLVLRDQRRRRHLRDHEAGIEPRPWRQERRQARQRRIDEHRQPALRQRADLADRHGDHVGGEGHRLGVEIAARQRLAVLREDQRVVGDAVGLRLQALRRRCAARPGRRP